MKSNLSDEEYSLFTLKLQRRFNEEIKSNVKGRITLITTKSPAYIKVFSNYHIKPIVTGREGISKYQSDFLSINDVNEIILATPTPDNVPYHLYRHLRNSIAHSWIIKYDEYYEFIDYYDEHNDIISMICRLGINNWEDLIDKIYNASKLIPMNVHVIKQLDLLNSSTNIHVKKDSIINLNK